MKWTQAECATVMTLYPDVTKAAQELGRTKKSVQEKALKLGLRQRAWGAKHVWLAYELKFLLANYGPMTAAEIGKHLGRSKLSVNKKIQYLQRGRNERS